MHPVLEMAKIRILKGPQDNAVLGQKDGCATAKLTLKYEAENAPQNELFCFVRVIDMKSGTRIMPPLKRKLTEDNEVFDVSLEIPAGGPYRIDTYIRGGVSSEYAGERRFNIGVGDVFVIAGQSNAVGTGRDLISEDASDSVHLFRACGAWGRAEHPVFDSTDTKYPYFQGAGYSPWITFAKIISRRLGYPIGLIPAAVGGTPLSFWDRRKDGKLFKNMLDMLRDADCGYVKGILWSQGCNESETGVKSEQYAEEFKSVYADFESVFYKGVPVVTVQLNKIVCYKDRDIDALGKGLAEIRDAQFRLSREIENVFVAPSIDLSVCDGIHNCGSSSLVIGQRTADLASKHIYKKDVICDAPEIDEIRKCGSKAVLYFKNVYDGLFSDLNNTDTLMFSLYDGGERYFPVDYECKENTVELTFEKEIGENAYISCDRYNETGLIPYDMFSYLPIIPFNKEYVK